MDINGLRDFQQTLVVRGIAQSTVTAGMTLNVNFSGTTIKCRATRGLTIAVGDIVLAVRQGFELVVLERLHAVAPGADPSDSTAPPNPWNSVQTGKTVIYPVETRSWREELGWRKDTLDLLQGNWGGRNHMGVAFYGNGPRALSGAEVLTASIKIKRDPGSDWSVHEPSTIKRVEEKTLTSTMVHDKTEATFVSGTVVGPELRPREAVNWTIPVSWGQSLVDEVAGGLAFHTNTLDPKARMEGRDDWGPSMALTLTWRRVI